MVGILPASLLLTISAVASANPVRPHHLPRNYAAIGDSFSAGLGSGAFIKNSRDGRDLECIRQDGSYPSQLSKIIPFSKHNSSFEFTACSGDKLDDIDGQVANLTALHTKFDLITLTIGGNDFGFGDIARACVYPTLAANFSSQQAQFVCDKAFNAGFAALADKSNWTKFADKINLVKSLLSHGGKLFVTGYGKFFDDPVVGDACDKISFFPVAQLAALNMTVGSRIKANNITDQVNGLIQAVLKEMDDHKVTFFDFDKTFEGKRFCEAANADDPIGSNNANVFFNDLSTVLPTPGVAEVSKQTPGLQVDITEVLQQVSVFHPKAQAYTPLVAKFAFKILANSK
jgi:lysophospholipase L1-like esterase